MQETALKAFAIHIDWGIGDSGNLQRFGESRVSFQKSRILPICFAFFRRFNMFCSSGVSCGILHSCEGNLLCA